MLSVPVLRISFSMLAAIGIFSYNFRVTLPLFVSDSLHSTEAVFTILYSIFSLGAVVSALVVANRQLVQIRHVIIGAIALGIAMIILACMPNVGTSVLAVFLVGMASILYMTATTAIVQVDTKRELHGRVLALQTVLIGGTSLIGGPLLGSMADLMGGRAPLALGGIVCLISAALGSVSINRVHANATPAH
jgi:MFS family permease